MAEIKAAGKGNITHYPEKESEDLTKLYNNIYMDPSTPTGLANRVQMNVRLYFCRRANENMESMTKDTFVIRIYSVTGRRYVMKKVDELTKNRREMDKENISGHMPEDREMPEYCPVVRNFETYLQKLHPQCNRLWQFSKDSFNISDECWFQKRPIGKDTLASFMSTLSKKTGLSQIYTNHSVRATGATILRKKLFNGTNYGSYRTQICIVSCSISTCFIKGKTSHGRHDHKFCSWRATISTILNNATAQYFPVATHAADTNSSSSTSLVQMRANTYVSSSVTDVVDILDVNYDDLFCDYNTLTTVNSVTNTRTIQQTPMFHGCTITNLNIAINK